MPSNLELKAYCENLDAAAEVCVSLGAATAGQWSQTDTYFNAQMGRLKLRCTSNGCDELIWYVRADEASARRSEYQRAPLPRGGAEQIGNILQGALGSFARVVKQRTRYSTDDWLVNLDCLEGVGDFIELEVFADRGEDRLREVIDLLRSKFAIRDTQVLPWSYSQVSAMYSRAETARAQLNETENAGTLFLIDGCSGSGKTTVIGRLESRLPGRYVFARRYSTRPPRQKGDDEYSFVSSREFASMKQHGEFIDSKDFLFGMSYGLAWSSVLPELLAGRHVVAPMNWGNALHVKRLFPEARVICLTVSEETIRRRLLDRGIHRDEEIEERLGNARRFADPSVPYDLVVSNETGLLERTIATIAEYLKCPA